MGTHCEHAKKGEFEIQFERCCDDMHLAHRQSNRFYCQLLLFGLMSPTNVVVTVNKNQDVYFAQNSVIQTSDSAECVAMRDDCPYMRLHFALSFSIVLLLCCIF